MAELPAKIGRYDVVRLLGQGGMGRVLLARDTVLGRDVAVKVLRDDLGLPPEMKKALFKRLRQEAKAAAAIAHPHMVTLHDMGDEREVGLYLVMEYVEGPTLRERIAEGPLTPEEVVVLAGEIGGALDRAHAANVIHRDVKPENVLLAKDGAKLTDFGIARMPDSTLTQGGAVLGTPSYCAPEALSKGEFGPTSDQFALSATLHEALSGRRAFPGHDALAVAHRIAQGDIRPFPELGRGPDLSRAEETLRRGMSRDPAMRFPSCLALARELESALLSTRALRPPTRIVPLQKAGKRPTRTDGPERTRALPVVVGALFLATLGAILIWRRVATSDDPEALSPSSALPAVDRAPSAGLHVPVKKRPRPSASPTAPAPTPRGDPDAGDDEHPKSSASAP